MHEQVRDLLEESRWLALRKGFVLEGFTEIQADRLVALIVWQERHGLDPADVRAPRPEPEA